MHLKLIFEYESTFATFLTFSFCVSCCPSCVLLFLFLRACRHAQKERPPRMSTCATTALCFLVVSFFFFHFLPLAFAFPVSLPLSLRSSSFAHVNMRERSDHRACRHARPLPCSSLLFLYFFSISVF